METNLSQQQSNCIKVVVFGPESTGKTTLAKQLATYYQTKLVPEFSRIYAEKKLKEGKLLEANDVMNIAKGQMKLENDFSQKADKLLVCDTDLLETKVYAEWYYPKFINDDLEKYAAQNTYDLYFLTYIDVPWKADGIRDMLEHREKMFEQFEEALQTYKKSYILLKGTMEQRFEKAKKAIDKLLLKP